MQARMQNYSEKELTRIHDASMDLQQYTGVAFDDDEALGIFKNNGFKVDGHTVFSPSTRFARPITDKAAEIVNERLAQYLKPDIDPQLEKDLLSYVQKRKKKSDR